MQFSLPEPTRATLSSVNLRTELHGKDHVNAVDLKFTMTAANTMLDELHLGPLRQMFYMPVPEGGEPPAQPELDGIPPVTDTPVLRCAEIEPIKLKHEWAGYTALLDRGIQGDASNIELGGCEVGQMVVDMLQGGSCKFTFRVQVSGIESEKIGLLASMLGLETRLTLVPPAAAQATT